MEYVGAKNILNNNNSILDLGNEDTFPLFRRYVKYFYGKKALEGVEVT